jgi:predicted sugar kinase
MQTELTTPACLLLGMAQLDGQICQLGITLQFPQIQLLARKSPGLAVSGARADLARRQAERFFQHLAPQAEIEIELAIPQFMGLGSAGMLGLSVAQALAKLHAQPDADPASLAQSVGLAEDEVLEIHAFAQGGLLLVNEQGELLRRHPIAHTDEADDWVFVFVLPRPSAATPETLERDQRVALRMAARHLGAETAGIITADLWPAVERDDIAAFAQALTGIHALNQAALDRAGWLTPLSPHEQAILDMMRDAGALAAGRTLAGLGLYGLIRGGGPSRDLRRALTERLGYFGGTVMASICDNNGAR